MPQTSFKRKGFTLIEILVMIVVISVLSIAALSSMIKSQDQFSFKSVVNESTNILRTIRSYALSNKPMPDGSVPTQYGAKIVADTTKTITIFGDKNGDSIYDAGEKLKTYTIPVTSINYTLKNGIDTTDATTLTIFYQPTTANFSIVETTSFTNRYATIVITDSANNRTSNIVLFKESGNPEVLSTLDDVPN